MASTTSLVNVFPTPDVPINAVGLIAYQMTSSDKSKKTITPKLPCKIKIILGSHAHNKLMGFDIYIKLSIFWPSHKNWSHTCGGHVVTQAPNLSQLVKERRGIYVKRMSVQWVKGYFFGIRACSSRPEKFSLKGAYILFQKICRLPVCMQLFASAFERSCTFHTLTASSSSLTGSCS